MIFSQPMLSSLDSTEPIYETASIVVPECTTALPLCNDQR